MSLPVLLVVDGDLDALGDVEAQLVRRYGHDYRVESASDPEEALRALAELADARCRAGAGAGGRVARGCDRRWSCSSERGSSIRTPSAG